eukprot:SAG11_NODE_12854_length_682_cov_1.144082_1_plen_138_part_01
MQALSPQLMTGEDRYEIQQQLGKGTSKVVFRALQKDTGELVAIGQIAPTGPDKLTEFDVQALREIKFLSELNHQNIVPLLDVYKSRGSGCINLVFEFMQYGELKQVIENRAKTVLGRQHIKGYMVMILEGMAFLHKNW